MEKVLISLKERLTVGGEVVSFRIVIDAVDHGIFHAHGRGIFAESGEAEIGISDIINAVSHLKSKYSREDSGLSLISADGCYRIVARADNNEYVEKILIKTKKKSLSQAALEVLSIIAYRQPVTKVEIDEIRGVKSDSAISNLYDNGLIYESGRLDKIGKPILYSTTEKFLVEFGITSLSELPENTDEDSRPTQINIGEEYGK